jgi:drug/metabolite transporter (DMT)-like permease
MSGKSSTLASCLGGCVSPKALFILMLLTFQNCAVALFLRYTRMRTDVPNAHIGCVLLLQELLKFLISVIWCVHEVKGSLSYHPPSSKGQAAGGSCETSIIGDARTLSTSTTQINVVAQPLQAIEMLGGVTAHHAQPSDDDETSDDRGRPMSYSDVITKRTCRLTLVHAIVTDVFNRQGLKLLIPSGLFSLQNALLFVAMANLEPTTFLVLYQSKILTTGILMVLLLGRTFSPQKWFAMVVLLSGIMLTQYNPGKKAGASGESLSTGLTAVLICSLSSSIAGVVMEKFMKDGGPPTTGGPSSSATPLVAPATNSHLSTKNVHLSFFSMVLVGVPVVFRIFTGTDESFVSILYGVDGVVLAMIMNQALGGILVALSLRHADNILKTFATTCAIVVGGVVSHFLFGFVPSASFLLGSMTVMGAIVLYGMPDVC